MTKGKVLIAMSGGVDSSVAALLMKEEGMTPNPCIDCNRYMKFDRLYERARVLGCDFIVTGHYARVRKEQNKYQLLKAVDETKDQSYVLYQMTQQELAGTKFPLGELTKKEARRIAEEYDFINANKPDSQDICFVPDGDYVSALKRFSGKVYEPGYFVDRRGNIIGKHKGIVAYTIGQRKGLGISAAKPLYVCEIDVDNNRVVLGENEDLFSRSVDVREVTWISGIVPEAPVSCKVKLRYRMKEQPAVIYPNKDNIVHIEFEEPQRAKTPGQAAVFYDGDVVLGGGIICGH